MVAELAHEGEPAKENAQNDPLMNPEDVSEDDPATEKRDASILQEEAEELPTERLHAAARRGDVDGIRQALALGAEMNSQDVWGLAALHSAALGGHAQAVALLLECRADLDSKSMRGQTALHLAVTEAHEVVVSILVGQRADVLMTTAHGTTVLTLAQLRKQGGSCERQVREELSRRWSQAEREVQNIRRQLQAAEAARGVAEAQLGGPPDGFQKQEEVPPSPTGSQDEGAVASTTGTPHVRSGRLRRSPNARRGGKGMRKSKTKSLFEATYWQYVERMVGEARLQGELAQRHVCLRPQASQTGGAQPRPVSSTEAKSSSGASLPSLDPEDTELAAVFKRLCDAGAEYRLRRAYRNLDGEVHAHNEKVMLERTGRTQDSWDKVVLDLRKSEEPVDWWKVELRECTEDVPVGPATFQAVFVSESGAFHDNEIIGSLGGVVRRKSRHNKIYYPEQTRLIHDPVSYEFGIHAKAAELRSEPLVEASVPCWRTTPVRWSHGTHAGIEAT